MNSSQYHLTDEERYRFDLQGYLLVPGALCSEEVDACNRAIDAVAGTPAADESMLGWPVPHRDPFRRLSIHPAVVARLNEICGPRFRLDQGPHLETCTGPPSPLQGGGEPFSPADWYHQQNGRIFCSSVIAAWQLASEGGLCVVAGSHKGVESTPGAVRRGSGVGEDVAGIVRRPAMCPGDLLLFTTAVSHGALPAPGEGERRILLYPYGAHAVVRTAGRPFLPEEYWGEWTLDLTPEQRAVLFAPGTDTSGRLPVLESDGSITRVRGGTT